MKYIYFYLVLVFASCKVAGNKIFPGNGYYIGNQTKGIILKYTYVVRIMDSIATFNAYEEQKGMVTAYDVFQKKQILPNTTTFNCLKNPNGFLLFNLTDTFKLEILDGQLRIIKPNNIKLKYYQSFPNQLIPSNNKALFDYCWFYPSTILDNNVNLSIACITYIQNKLQSDFAYKHDKMNYDEFYLLLKSNIKNYKEDFDKQ